MKFNNVLPARLAGALLLCLPLTAVSAQSLVLHSGDHIKVDATGTHGVISGHNVSNPVTTYVSVGKSAMNTDNDAVEVHGNASFSLGAGGTITGGANGYALESLDTSSVTIAGGTVTNKASTTTSMGTPLHADDNSKITITGGVIAATMYGSAITVDLDASVLLAGGTITTYYGSILAPEGDGKITVIGGSMSATHAGIGLMAGGMNGTINLFSQTGKPFILNGVSTNKLSLAPNATGTISGTLPDGSSIDTNFLNGGHINLNIGKPPKLP